ncbi:MAG: zinc-ribbon domain-containing protein [Pseudomonadota bacterium]
MRLICPNCDAQYEVPDEIIPEHGRDVQCSNCGQTWFQNHPDHDPGPEEIDDDQFEELLGPDAKEAREFFAKKPADKPKAEPAKTEADETTTAAEPADNKATAAPASADETPADDPGLKQRRLDPQVESILREEAALETMARSSDKAPLESQPDLGLDASPSAPEKQRLEEGQNHLKKVRGQDELEATPDGEALAAAAALGSRRELLPDIEEINSALRDEVVVDEETAEIASRRRRLKARARRSAFRRGFIFALLVVAILVGVYAFAPQISEALPQAGPYMNEYVVRVDQLRSTLDVQAQAGLTWLQATISEMTSPAPAE